MKTLTGPASAEAPGRNGMSTDQTLPKPPSPEEIAEIFKRALSANPATGRSTRDLLERMKAGDEDGVREFIKE